MTDKYTAPMHKSLIIQELRFLTPRKNCITGPDGYCGGGRPRCDSSLDILRFYCWVFCGSVLLGAPMLVCAGLFPSLTLRARCLFYFANVERTCLREFQTTKFAEAWHQRVYRVRSSFTFSSRAFWG